MYGSNGENARTASQRVRRNSDNEEAVLSSRAEDVCLSETVPNHRRLDRDRVSFCNRACAVSLETVQI